MIALGACRSRLRSLHTTELLDPSMIVLYRPSVAGILDAGQFAHLQIIGGPVFNVTVRGDDLEHPNEPIALQMHNTSTFTDLDLADGYQPLTIWIDQTIRFQPRQPNPLKSADFLEVGQAGVPTIKGHTLGLEAAFVRLVQHLLEVVVLRQAIIGFVIESVVARDVAVAIRPQQGHEVNAAHHRMMFTRPVTGDQLDLASKGLIQSRVVKNEDAIAQINLGLGFLPHGFGIRLEAVQQALESVVCRRPLLVWLHTGGFGGAASFGCRNQKVDIVLFVAFGRIHESFLPQIGATA